MLTSYCTNVNDKNANIIINIVNVNILRVSMFIVMNLSSRYTLVHHVPDLTLTVFCYQSKDWLASDSPIVSSFRNYFVSPFLLRSTSCAIWFAYFIRGLPLNTSPSTIPSFRIFIISSFLCVSPSRMCRLLCINIVLRLTFLLLSTFDYYGIFDTLT